MPNSEEMNRNLLRTGGLLYSWMPEQAARPYGSSYKPMRNPRKFTALCKGCGEDITNLFTRTARPKYCLKCRIMKRQEYQQNRKTLRGPILPRMCHECLLPFTPKAKHYAEFCSSLCWTKFHRRKTAKPRLCNECLSPIPFMRRKYCTKICRDIAVHRRAITRLEQMKEKRHGN